MPIRFTSKMQPKIGRKLIFMIDNALRHFPELAGQTITVGYTRAHLGAAIPEDLTIRLRARKVSYNTIGHELMHLVQGRNGIPEGEKQCDVWTLARAELFCDEAPTYLRLPETVQARWPHFALKVRELCLQAIALRQSQRYYIRWLERAMVELSSTTPITSRQLALELLDDEKFRFGKE